MCSRWLKTRPSIEPSLFFKVKHWKGIYASALHHPPDWVGCIPRCLPMNFSHTVHIDTIRIQSPWANINHHHKSINPIFPLKYHITIGNINPHFFTCFSLKNPHNHGHPVTISVAVGRSTPPRHRGGRRGWLHRSKQAAPRRGTGRDQPSGPRRQDRRGGREVFGCRRGAPLGELSKERGMCVVADYEQKQVNILGMNRKWRLTSIVGLMLNVDLVVGCSSQSRSEYKPCGSVW